MAATPPVSRVTQTTRGWKWLVFGVPPTDPQRRSFRSDTVVRPPGSPGVDPGCRFDRECCSVRRRPVAARRTLRKALTCIDGFRGWIGTRSAGVRSLFGFCSEAVYALFEGRRSATLVTLRTSGWPWIPNTGWPLPAGATRPGTASARWTRATPGAVRRRSYRNAGRRATGGRPVSEGHQRWSRRRFLASTDR